MRYIAILDYGIGNIRSMFNAVKKVDAEAIITSDRKTILDAQALIVPGVGSYRTGMKYLDEGGLVEVCNKFKDSGKTMLGVCLGMQLFVSKGHEGGDCKGLNLISGCVEKMQLQTTNNIRLPHVGWNNISLNVNATIPLFKGTDVTSQFYFVHSYAATRVPVANILCTTSYGGTEFVSGIQKENVIGLQFHPEKSSQNGLKIIKNMCCK